jgi:hypothetical protein
MKDAKEWVIQLPPDVLEHPLPFPQRLDYAVKIVKRIQIDALRHASNFCHNASPNAPHSYIRDEILAAAKELES